MMSLALHHRGTDAGFLGEDRVDAALIFAWALLIPSGLDVIKSPLPLFRHPLLKRSHLPNRQSDLRRLEGPLRCVLADDIRHRRRSRTFRRNDSTKTDVNTESLASNHLAR